MGYSPGFFSSDRALDEGEAAALAQEALDVARWALIQADVDQDAEILPREQIASALAPAGPERVIRLEHILIATIWLASIGVGLYRLLM